MGVAHTFACLLHGIICPVHTFTSLLGYLFTPCCIFTPAFKIIWAEDELVIKSGLKRKYTIL